MDCALRESRKRNKLLDIIFYVLFVVFYNYHFMVTTMFYSELLYVHAELFKNIYNYSYYALLVLSFFSLLFLYDNIKTKLFPAAVIAVVLIYNHIREVSDFPVIAVFFMLVICAKGKSYRVLGNLMLFFGWAWILASAIACRLGVISDIVFYGTRHSFGSVYMTDLACHFLTLMMVLCIVRNGKMKIYDYGLGVLLMIVNLLFMKAKVGFACLFLLLCGTYVYQYIIPRSLMRYGTRQTYKKICSFGILVLIPIVFYFTITYSESPSMFYNRIGVLSTLRSRFMLGRQALDQYDITLWGVPIYERGNGGSKSGMVDNYFFIDISYLRILLMNGVFIWILTILMFIKTQIRLARENKLFLMFVVSVFLLDCSIEHHIVELAYSFMPYLLFCELSSNNIRRMRPVV